MRTLLPTLTLSLILTGFLSACSITPKSSEPEMGAALASSTGSNSLIVDGVLFDFEEAALKPGANEIVSRAVDYLRANPRSLVTVEGHTDHVGPKSYNQKLSEKRAGTVVKALKAQGISTDRITSVGYGETKPMADNKTIDGRNANRRVEIIFRNGFNF